MSKEYTIRVMTLEDYDEVYALWMGIHGFGIRSIDDSKEGVERFLKRNPTTSMVAVADGKIVGAILCGHDGRRGCELGNHFWKDAGWCFREDLNYYDFTLNEANITRFNQ